jgi:peroxiredoxin
MKRLNLIVLLLLSIVSLRAAAQTGLKAGMEAPPFSARDNAGQMIRLKDLLKTHKAVVLFFYRGQWCPYCNRYISKLEDSLRLLIAKGAYVIGVTPETDENIQKTVNKTHASFSLIHDNGYRIMKAYEVNYVVDTAMMTTYRKYGVDLDKGNGNDEHVLPVPATYIIDHTGKIIFVHFDKDYRNRASVSDLLKAL